MTLKPRLNQSEGNQRHKAFIEGDWDLRTVSEASFYQLPIRKIRAKGLAGHVAFPWLKQKRWPDERRICHVLTFLARFATSLARQVKKSAGLPCLVRSCPGMVLLVARLPRATGSDL